MSHIVILHLQEQRLKGTTVTVDSFLEWKARFDEERRKKMNKKVETNKLTGKRLSCKERVLMFLILKM